MKKKFLAFLLIFIFCSGCTKDAPDKNIMETGTTCEPVKENSDGKEKVAVKNKKSSDSKSDLNVYDLLDQRDKYCLELWDLRSRNIIRTIPYKKNEVIAVASEYKDGYVVIKMRQAAESDVENKGGVVIMENNEPSELLECNLELYNAKLSKINTISLLDYLKKDKVDKENLAYRTAIINEDATKVAFLLEDSIYCIDLAEKKTKFLKSFSRHNITLGSSIIFVEKNKIGFMGDMLEDGEKYGSCCYGYMDIETDAVKYKTVKNYDGFSLGVSGKYLYMNDGEDPYTNSSSGKIYILDCDTDETIEMELDGLESTMSGITEDGTKLIAIKMLNENSFRIRNYDIVSKKVVFEKVCKKDISIKPHYIKKIGDNKYGVVCADEKGMTVEDAVNNK